MIQVLLAYLINFTYILQMLDHLNYVQRTGIAAIVVLQLFASNRLFHRHYLQRYVIATVIYILV